MPRPDFTLLADFVSSVCVAGMFLAVLANFLAARDARRFRERRSVVATFSMAVFGVTLVLTIRFGAGAVAAPPHGAVYALRVAGLAAMLGGLLYNLWGRVHLRGNWSDHVRVYDDHFIVQDGPYRFVRHPLYASLIWMFLGASAAYLNWLAALETLLIFLPAMTYRAMLEERALEGRFGEAYAAYRARTPRFFPRPSALFRAGDR